MALTRHSTIAGRDGVTGHLRPDLGELTLGNHLLSCGVECWLIDKTHMKADVAGMARLGLPPNSVIGARQSECGFDVWWHNDGLCAVGAKGPYDSNRSPHNEYLTSKGYPGKPPAADFANAGLTSDDVASGWFMKNANRPANTDEPDSETPWLATEAIRIMDATQGPWCAQGRAEGCP